MSGEVAQRALDWWAGLVEHLFGLPVRTPEQEKAVVPAAEDHSSRQKVMHADLALLVMVLALPTVVLHMLCGVASSNTDMSRVT